MIRAVKGESGEAATAAFSAHKLVKECNRSMRAQHLAGVDPRPQPTLFFNIEFLFLALVPLKKNMPKTGALQEDGPGRGVNTFFRRGFLTVLNFLLLNPILRPTLGFLNFLLLTFSEKPFLYLIVGIRYRGESSFRERLVRP